MVPVAVGLVLLAVVRTPERRTGFYAVRGHRVLGVSGPAVRGVDVTLDRRRFSARRSAGSWEIDGRLASPRVADALGDLVDTLTGLRAVDTFRSRDSSTYGVDRPRATIDVTTARSRRRLVLGDLNAGGSAYYARKEGDPRILLVGAALVTDLERVLYASEAASGP